MARKSFRWSVSLCIYSIDAVYFSVREDNRIVKKASYIVLGINSEGFKEILGIWIGENETAKYWLSVLNELKQRGVEDILIICSNNLTGIKETINALILIWFNKGALFIWLEIRLNLLIIKI